MQLRHEKDISKEALLELYESVGWTSYTRKPALLTKAVRNSTYVVSVWEGGTLIGLARGLSDDVSIFYLQDILVRPEWQRRGIGRRLLRDCLERFQHVRQKVLLTNTEQRQTRFYETLGFKDVARLGLNAFVQFGESGPM